VITSLSYIIIIPKFWEKVNCAFLTKNRANFCWICHLDKKPASASENGRRILPHRPHFVNTFFIL